MERPRERLVRIVTYDDVVALLREGVAQAGSRRAYAWGMGLHEGDLGQVLRERKLPSERMCHLVGIERHLVQMGEPMSPVLDLDLKGASDLDEEIHALRQRLRERLALRSQEARDVR
jgi:hypothetical protein